MRMSVSAFRWPTGANSPKTWLALQPLPVQQAFFRRLTPTQKSKAVAALIKDPEVPGPVYMNEDDNGRETVAANLRNELASCDAVWNAGGSWGYMPWVQLQIYPFRHVQPAATSELSDDMPTNQRDPAYFKAVLVHIRDLVFAR